MEYVTQTIDFVQASAAAEDRYVNPPGRAGEEWELDTTAYFCPATSVSANDTNYVTAKLVKNSTDLTGATFNTKVTGGAALAAGTNTTMTLTDGVGTRQFTTGTDVLKINIAIGGSGAVCDGSFHLVWHRVY
jgi:hypothetical protein